MSNDNWIPVHEHLPHDWQVVLFCSKDGVGDYSWYKYPTTVGLGTFHVPKEFRHFSGSVGTNVTHWMPIPLPPKL